MSLKDHIEFLPFVEPAIVAAVAAGVEQPPFGDQNFVD